MNDEYLNASAEEKSCTCTMADKMKTPEQAVSEVKSGDALSMNAA